MLENFAHKSKESTERKLARCGHCSIPHGFNCNTEHKTHQPRRHLKRDIRTNHTTKKLAKYLGQTEVIFAALWFPRQIFPCMTMLCIICSMIHFRHEGDIFVNGIMRPQQCAGHFVWNPGQRIGSWDINMPKSIFKLGSKTSFQPLSRSQLNSYTVTASPDHS